MSIHLRNKMTKAGCVTRLLFLFIIIFGLGYLFFNYVYIPDQAPFRDNVIENNKTSLSKYHDHKSEQELDSLISKASMFYESEYIDSVLTLEGTNAKIIKVRSMLKDTSSLGIKVR